MTKREDISKDRISISILLKIMWAGFPVLFQSQTTSLQNNDHDLYTICVYNNKRRGLEGGPVYNASYVTWTGDQKLDDSEWSTNMAKVL